MAVRLDEALGTRYITIDYVRDLDEFLSKNSSVDLANCRFTPKAEQVLRKYYDKVEFINSTNKALNALLQMNMEASKQKPPVSVPLRANIRQPQDVLTIFRSLDENVIYNLSEMSKQNENPMHVCYLAILIMMKKPQIMFDLEYYAIKVFETVRKDWLKVRGHHDAYWELDAMSLVKREVKDGMVYVQGTGNILEVNYVREFTVLPYEFGTQDLYGHPEFEDVWLNALTALTQQTTKIKTMKDFIEVFE